MRINLKHSDRSMKHHLLLTLILLFAFNLHSFGGRKSPNAGNQQLAGNHDAEYPQEFRVVGNKMASQKYSADWIW